jgi:hypothetical protein
MFPGCAVVRLSHGPLHQQSGQPSSVAVKRGPIGVSLRVSYPSLYEAGTWVGQLRKAGGPDAPPPHSHDSIHGSFQRTNQSQDHRVRVFRKTFTSADADHNVGGCLTNLAHRNLGAWKAMVRPRCEKSHLSDHAELTVSFTPAFKKLITKCPQLPLISNRRMPRAVVSALTLRLPRLVAGRF